MRQKPAEPFTPRFLKPPTEILPRIGMGTHIRPIHLALGDGCWQIVRPRSLGSCTLQAFPIALPQYLVAFCSLRYERLETGFVPCVLSIPYISSLSRAKLEKIQKKCSPPISRAGRAPSFYTQPSALSIASLGMTRVSGSALI